jgi:4-alpha-glucanotransferase
MDLHAEAAELGIDTSFVDVTGHNRTVDPLALQILVKSVPVKPQHRLLTGDLIWRGDHRPSAELSDRSNCAMKWQLYDEHHMPMAEGICSEGNISPIADAWGIHALTVTDADGICDTINVLSVPQKAFEGDFDRVWILAVQLYGVRSSRNWGMGDFTDLAWLTRWAAETGAAGVGVNPLHVLFDDEPEQCSPYSPSSRLFLNPLYIDVTGLPEWDVAFAVEHEAAIAALQRAEIVDYSGIAHLKHEALRRAFTAFKLKTTLKRRTALEDFRSKSPQLFRFSCFEALRRKFGRPWWEWPERWRSPSDAALEELRQGPEADDIHFVEFQQWCADQQLKSCRDLARDLKLPVGLYLDIAVGVACDGFDAWNEQIAISRNLSVGAPPDLLNTGGQDWGLAGFTASGLERTSYKPYQDMLESAMRYAGAVRIDHVLGLNRLYLVPRGYLPSEGAYVQMPLEALLAVTALESVRNRCVVVGEDLGTVPDGFRERLSDWGIWSYRVMMFERDQYGSFHPPHYYPQDSLVTFNTHDLATYRGWQSAYDIDAKNSLGMDPGETPESRAHAHAMLERALGEADLNDASFASVLQYLSRTRCRILAISAEDILDVLDQPNIPGTIKENPNWRRRLPVNLEDWYRSIDRSALEDSLRDRQW